MSLAATGLLVTCVLAACLFAAGCTSPEDINASERIGMLEDCRTTDGWYETDDDKKIAPRVKMASKNGQLHVVTNRGVLEVAHRYKWVAPGSAKLTRLRKDYGIVDMDKYRYLVVNIKSKGSAVFFAINGYMPKVGHTTGTTCVDLRDCQDPAVSGTKPVRLSLDLHDNMTTFVLDEIKLVSELTDEERKGLVGRGLTIREENLTYKDYHGLEQLKKRSDTAPPNLDREEMAIFRDSATGAISTRLTAAAGNDFFGEGEPWSSDGAAFRFTSRGRGLRGIPVYTLADGSVTSTDIGGWAQWSRLEPDEILVVSRKSRRNYTVDSWNRKTGRIEPIVSFDVRRIGGYTEVKRFTKSGKLIVAFRETPDLYVVDTQNKTVEHIELSTRLKDVGFSSDEKFIRWYNCYTYEGRWRNVKTGEEGVANSYSAGHGAGAVRSFGPYLKVTTTADISRDDTPGDKIRIWANWQNHVVTDYGSFTADRRWIFTNGTRGDVKRQHVMVPSDDTGAVLRLARYFTKFSWDSTTYSRPSPDYTKLIYNENCFGPTQITMVYVRRPDAPRNVTLDGKRITWELPERCKEIAGYNVYASGKSGRDFVKINDQLVAGLSYDLPDDAAGYCVVTAVEHSRLESTFSAEVTRNDSHTYYFEAEDQQLTAPARRFYDGYCNGFQCVRINAESPEEAAVSGQVALKTGDVQPGRYRLWARAKGKGTWTVGDKATAIDANDWQWVMLAEDVEAGDGRGPTISSADDSLKLDTAMLTTESFQPSGGDPRDTTAPEPVTGLAAKIDRQDRHVTLTWDASDAADLNHYSVYCGEGPEFACDNASLIRSVYKTVITDAGMAADRSVYYKVVAYDSRHNASPAATISVDME